MINTELTLDQLQAVSGGGVFAKLGDIKGEYRQIVHPQYQKGEYRQIVHPSYGIHFPEHRNRVAGSAGPGGDDI